MKNKFITHPIFFSVISIIFFSCEDGMLNRSGVSGKIYYENLVPASNKQVMISDATVLTGPDGSFLVNNVVFPYDITLIDSNYSYPEYTVYKNLTTENVNLVLDYIGNSTYNAMIEINFTGNVFANDLEGKLIFTDGEYFNKYVSFQNFSNNSTTYLNIDLPDNSVTGKIILITYKKNNTGEIISYENYGEINSVIINSIGYNSYTFDSAAVSLNPGEVSVSGSNNILPGENRTLNSIFYLSYTNKNYRYNYLSSDFGNVTGDNFNFLIPTGLPTPFNVFVKKDIYAGGGVLSGNYLVEPGIYNNIEIKSPSLPINPEANASNVTNNTYFTYSAGGGKGVYEIFIKNTSALVSYRIVTASENFSMNDINIRGFESIKDNDFFWLIFKHGEFISMNDYAIDKINRPEWFSNRSYSQGFHTAP
ncbi:MAG TPA: hypothetical protein PKC58_12245 [Ignavibacteria bacterium]|nr:hypothetical protein [Ignavibacteria bacterium]